MDAIHTALDAAGLVPAVGIIPDALNAVIYLAEGDMVNAGFAGAAMIPLAGQAATATKYGAKAVDAASDTVIVAKKTATKVAKHIDPKLDEHLEAVAAYKKRYEKRLAESIKKGDPARIQGAFKAKITEAKGELGASMYMQKNLSKPPPPATMEMGFGPGPGLDQVWAKRDTDGKVLEYFVVEAKGPGAKLQKTKTKGPQMSKKWVRKNLESMENSKKYQEKNQLGEDILDAIDNESPKVTKLVIEAVEANGKVIGGKLQPVPKG